MADLYFVICINCSDLKLEDKWNAENCRVHNNNDLSLILLNSRTFQKSGETFYDTALLITTNKIFQQNFSIRADKPGKKL